MFRCSPEEQVLPMLRFVQKRGNCTVYEWRTGTAPSTVERPHLEEPPEQVEEDTVRRAEGELLPANTRTHSPALDNRNAESQERGICVRENMGGRAQKTLLLYFLGLLESRV